MQTLQVERADGVVTITLDRPERKNAVDTVMQRELRDTLRELRPDPDVRCVVLTGANGEFCSGADLAGETAGKHPLAAMRDTADLVLSLHDLPHPTIAKVRGVAVGLGCNLALGCDLVVASENARFSQIFARRGLAVDGGGSYLLPRLVGLHRAKELALLADIVPAPVAAEMGLVNRVLPDGELDAFVDDWARRLASGPPIALALSKSLLNQGLAVSMAQALEAEGHAQAVNFATADTTEAFRAFFEKRDPTFRGH